MDKMSISKLDRFKLSEWEVVIDAPDIVNIPYLMHDSMTKGKDTQQRYNSKFIGNSN